jgi:hypothetical protein
MGVALVFWAKAAPSSASSSAVDTTLRFAAPRVTSG